MLVKQLGIQGFGDGGSCLVTVVLEAQKLSVLVSGMGHFSGIGEEQKSIVLYIRQVVQS